MASDLFHTKKHKTVEVPAPLAPLADTHGHLTAFRKIDPAQAVARAALVGVRLLVVPVDPADDVQDVPEFLSWFCQIRTAATDLLQQAASRGDVPPTLASYEDAPDLVDNVHIVAGVHPYGAQVFMDDPAIRRRLEALLACEDCVGVGEFGLDYGPWNKLPADVQIAAFREQLRIAHERGLPVELHLRDADGDEAAQAHADALRVLGEEGVPQAGCDLHCFTSDVRVMTPFTKLGCHVAFGGAATFARSADIREAAEVCPQGLLLSETDCPYMAPVPLRGLECEPAMVAFTAACVADVREKAGAASREQTYATLWKNANSFFRLG
jgi:TatD DNase family protein